MEPKILIRNAWQSSHFIAQRLLQGILLFREGVIPCFHLISAVDTLSA